MPAGREDARSGLTVEAEITPDASPSELMDLARAAEAAGFDRLGVSDVALYPDSFMAQLLCVQATERLHVGAMVSNPYIRHPAALAAAVATLHEASDGRAFLGIGVGAGLEALGLHYPQPVATLRESIIAIRALLAGETVTTRGRVFQLHGARLTRPPSSPVRIAVGTRSPQIMRLAGELADVALVGGRYLTTSLAMQYQAWLSEGASRAGRTLADIEVAPRLTLCVAHDGELAKRSVKRYVAHYLALLAPADLDVAPDRVEEIRRVLEGARGWYFDHDRYDPPELDDLVDADLVRHFAIAGTPEECLEQARAVVALGFSSISMNLAAVRWGSMYAGLRETIEGFGEVMEQLKR